VSWGVYPLHGRDALYVRWNGGGGYGDPVSRDPAAVAADVRSGVVSDIAGRDVYGVALDSAGGVDAPGTIALRQAIRDARLASQEAAE